MKFLCIAIGLVILSPIIVVAVDEVIKWYSNRDKV